MKIWQKFLFLAALSSLVALGIFTFQKSDPLTGKVTQRTETPDTPIEKPFLSPLAPVPDWSVLEKYQYSISKEKFLHLLTTYYVTGDAWQKLIQVNDTSAEIVSHDAEKKVYTLHFSRDGKNLDVTRTWQKFSERKHSSSEKPLSGLRIAIDAGHIGGQFAQMEERWFRLHNDLPVTEGDMTLYVALLLKMKLEAAGATVFLVRDKVLPVTELRPENLLRDARIALAGNPNEMLVQKEAEKLFYRTAEIRARAKIVNEQIKPDFVLCLHFNAAAWGNPAQPQFVNENHFHLLLNGAYTDAEILLDDQRLEMIHHILDGNIEEEIPLAASLSDSFAKATSLPPYPYEDHSSSAIPIKPHLYLWARNLLANRLYQCPVIFFEPYVMNHKEVYERVQAGDYQGEQFVAGKKRKSIFQEYADALCDGLCTYYAGNSPDKN